MDYNMDNQVYRKLLYHKRMYYLFDAVVYNVVVYFLDNHEADVELKLWRRW